MKLSKRNILWIVPIAIIGIFFWIYGPQKDITDNESIAYVKNHTLTETNTTKLEKIFSESCENPYWIYFKSQDGQAVVEFEGDCKVADDKGQVNVQFLVDNEQTDLSVGAILLDSAQLSDEEKEKFIDSMLSS